jgi:hypothetical protein
MENCRFFLVLMIMIASIPVALSQGCSDAGACSIEGFRFYEPGRDDVGKNQINLGINAGVANHSIFAFDASLGYTRIISSKFSVDTRVTFATRSGNNISISGPGDVYAIINYKFSSFFSFAGGVKFPTNRADKTYEGRMLPMDYQSSLGTIDLIAGITYKKSNWLIGLGYQLPVEQNQNVFIPSDWPNDSPVSEFVQTGIYERQGDILGRIIRRIPLQGNLTIIPGILPIFHLSNDNDYLYFDKKAIAGSSGLTLNATARLEVKTNGSGQFNLDIGFPLIVREVRPDGLTRSFVLGAEYNVRW